MLIQCTKKLIDQLDIKPMSEATEQPLFSWHANLIYVNHRKTIVLCNNSSRYVVVLHGLKAKDFKKLDEVILDAVRETLLDECIRPEIIEKYLNHSTGIIYSKTGGKALTARLNKACENALYFYDRFIPDKICQSQVAIRASHISVGEYNINRIYPNEVMYKDLEIFTKQPVISCEAVQLKIILDLENHEVWRKIIVPVRITFTDLHNIIQETFGWQDYHLHEYYIFKGNKPLVNLVCGEDAFDYPGDVKMIMETGIRLCEYVPEYSRIKYIYDFGDDWEHYIVVEKIIDDYPKNHPECIAGKGNTPPEDVGGEGGYDEFLEAINDPGHPDHEDMLMWGSSQRYKDFDIGYVNRILKHVLNGFR